MLNLIYKDNTWLFISRFNKCVESYDPSKLNFNTREEYLNWVKQWKEDMNIVTYKHTKNKLSWKRDACVRQDKIDRYQSMVNNMPELTEEQNARYNTLMNQFLADYGLHHYFSSSHYLVWYLLIIRKAAKIKACAQRVLRLQAVA